jgi:UDP-GlcNAc:undecaprenyl-phosphate GlcNAc-1-phosphate transferase
MPSIYLFYIFFTSLFSALVLIPPISRLAVTIGIFDNHDERKVHIGAIPRLGGIAIFFAVLLATILFGDIDRSARGFLAGGVVIFLTGLTDDLSGLTPRKKLLGQFVAALLVTVVGGLCVTSLGNLFGAGPIELGYLSVPFTVFAIVGVINAINMMDGLDGLAAGVTAIATATFGILAWYTGNQYLVGACVALLGALIGFLKFNSYPARIFMGDGGSLFLGYCLATFAIHLVERGTGPVSPMLPVVILAVPLCDTCYVMIRRLMKHQSVSAPDRSHIHHRLMDIGLG